MAPMSLGLAAAFSQHDVVMLQPLIPRDTVWCYWPYYCAAAASSTKMPSQADVNYDMGP